MQTETQFRSWLDAKLTNVAYVCRRSKKPAKLTDIARRLREIVRAVDRRVLTGK